MIQRALWLIGLCGAILMAGCKDSIVEIALDEEDIVEDEEAIFIVDRTGRRWDITHAVKEYGFNPGGFQFGLGVDAIPPLVNPVMLEPGDEGYPDPERDGDMLVMGVALQGIERAYPLTAMINHEVVDTDFDSMFVAVSY